MTTSKVKPKKNNLQRKRKKNSQVQNSSQTRTVKLSLLFNFLWTLVIIVFTAINFYQVDKAYERSAVRQAKILLERSDLIFGLLDTVDGFYLDLPESAKKKEIYSDNTYNTISGPKGQLHKINSAFFSEIINDFSAKEGISIHIVGFDKNLAFSRPNSWESAAIRRIERENLTEFFELSVNEDKTEIIHYIKPLYVTKDMLVGPNAELFSKYKLNEIYGAASITVPLYSFINDEKQSLMGVFVGHFIIWIIGLLFIYSFTKNLFAMEKRAKIAEGALEETKSSLNVQYNDQNIEMERLEEEKQAALNVKTDFLTSISHEIRTPLNGIIGMTELLLRTKLEEDQASMLASLRASGNNLLVVINDIWDFAKIEAGQIELERQSFPLRDTLFDVVKTLAPLAFSKNVEIVANISPQIPDTLVGDALRLRQILFKLIDNAIKFTNKGDVTLSVKLVAIENKSVKLVIGVKDTGIGIPLEKQNKIFKALEQEDRTTTRKYDGVGLGLTISSKLVQLMGSEIKLHSEPNKGSHFYFELEFPFLNSADVAAQPVSTHLLENVETLIVDDNATNRRILSEQLSNWKMKTTECTSVDEAMRMLRKAAESYAPFALVLTDLQMPEKDGVDLAQLMKKDKLLEHIPVILLSSGTMNENIPSSLFFANLAKPIRPSELLRVLSKAAEVWDAPELTSLHELESREVLKKTDESLKILLVEDLEINQIVTSRMLQELGHTTVIANNGQQAIEILEREKFDMVLMDIKMPIMDGLEALSIIRKLNITARNNKHLPVVAITANAREEQKEFYLSKGMNAYLLKPISISELADTLYDLVQKFEVGLSFTRNQAIAYEPSDNINQVSTKSAAVVDETPPVAHPRVPRVVQPEDMQPKNIKPSQTATSNDTGDKSKTESSNEATSTAKSTTERDTKPSVTRNMQPSTSTQSSITRNMQPSTSTQPSTTRNMQPSTSTQPSTTRNMQPSTSTQPSVNTQPSTQIKEEVKPKAPSRKIVAPLDAEMIERSFGTYPALALKSMEIFLRDSPNILGEIEKAVSQADNSSLTVNAHAMKGLVSYYTKGEIYQLALKLEDMGRDNLLPEQNTEVNKHRMLLEESLVSLTQAMQTYISE